jgi:CRP-like cAMP-binding protein
MAISYHTTSLQFILIISPKFCANSGEVVITKKDKGHTGESKVVHIARPTECFGELALLYNHPRAATVQVLSEG